MRKVKIVASERLRYPGRPPDQTRTVDVGADTVIHAGLNDGLVENSGRAHESSIPPGEYNLDSAVSNPFVNRTS